MIQSISYNLTDKESTLLKVRAEMFEDSYEFDSFPKSAKTFRYYINRAIEYSIAE